MNKKMLIDATYAEETRVVVLNDTKVEDFDFESSHKQQLKGNIYLAVVTRVEPSLQAAFVDFGGNRHGFLPFSEIHPDYFRIPVEDRQALLEAQRLAGVEGEDSDGGDDDDGVAMRDDDGNDQPFNGNDGDDDDFDAEDSDENAASANAEEGEDDGAESSSSRPRRRRRGGGRPADDAERKMRQLLRRYSIQEVIKSRQVMLVQIVKEERGNKGAALTTYLSLAGRYCVFLPNTTKSSGISRKINDGKDRQRLRSIIDELETPDGTAIILRTAGENRNKLEIKRDFEYLSRVWETIREDTLQSTAPAQIYEEGSLIKRAIRDIYNREIDEILVEGVEGFRMARELMRQLMPSHVRRVKFYQDPIVPLFHKYDVERQLEDIYNPSVKLRSGGYVVINPTEALVAVDVNSGRAIRERNVEETAYRTNLEAADEIARQLRLRDLAGLIVIDFIDMNDRRYRAAVEKRLRDALKNDRARVQIGHLSTFGLLELSRQRLRSSLLEIAADTCKHCSGTGHVRSLASSALQMLRVIEQEGITQNSSKLIIHLPTAVALYLLNHKREALSHLESRFGMAVEFAPDDSLIPPEHHVDRIAGTPGEFRPKLLPSSIAANPELDDDFADLPLEDEEELLEEATRKEGEDSEGLGRARRDDGDGENGRRRRRRGGRNRYRRSREDGESTPRVEWQGVDNIGSSDDGGTDPLLWDGDFPVVPELLTEPPANVSEEPKEAPLGRRRRGAGKVAAAAASAEELVSQPDAATTDEGKPQASSPAKGRGRKQAPKADEAVEAVASAESVEGETAVPAKAPPVSRDRAASRKKAAAESAPEESGEPSSEQASVVEPKARAAGKTTAKPVVSLVEKADVAEAAKAATPKAEVANAPFDAGEKIEEVLVTSGEKRERRGWWQRLIENP
ncbi:MAG: Rne/Rng family ribonuclease [Rhodospirillaceae bacterium]|jgi:ribonuclease E|nr:Rne/Rng family ribonuclease [Rhodospirillaceae bacterium]